MAETNAPGGFLQNRRTEGVGHLRFVRGYSANTYKALALLLIYYTLKIRKGS